MKRYVYIDDNDSSRDPYRDNRISNRKYTILNFLPKNLWEQFSRFMNQYFLLIACLQLWSLITPVNPASTWGPLIFIFAVSASKEAWDDYNRYLSDQLANEKEVWVVKQGIKKHIQAQDIHVGDIVWLRENDEVPCDLILIGTSEPQGICFIETAAMDGETDLKTRVIPSACMGIASELLHRIKGVIECPNPDKDIRRFDANLRLFPPFIDNDLCPLTINNTLLQSCYLRNTEWACGVAVYTGNETKLGMSRGIPEPKLTAMDAMIDKLTGAIFLFQIVVVIVLGTAGNVWKDTEARKQWYVLYPKEGPWYELLVIPLRFELLCSIMIPISIKVSLDLVKSLYAKFIDWDEEMYDQDTSTPSHAANTAISEDLGQVEYILTDKTGTLTENRMIFRRCCINGVFYGNESGDALKDMELLNAVGSDNPDVIRFLTVMAICNTVTPLKSKSGTISYKAQSQDEDALVQAAARLHMVLINKIGNILEIKFNASVIQYEVLNTLEFTSDRKRMSLVVKDWQNGKIILLSKGADEAILPYACAGQQIRTFGEAVEQYAQEKPKMLGLGFTDKKPSRFSFGARDDSPDSVIFTQGSNFSIFSSTSGSGDRCSFGSEIHDHEHLVSELAKHLAGRGLHDCSCGPDSDPNREVTVHKKNSDPVNDYIEKAKEEEDQTLDPANQSFSEALKECQNRRFRSEIHPSAAKKHDRHRRPASLDLNNRATDATCPSPRFGAMKKSSVPSRRLGTSPSPGTPSYRHGGVVGFQKGWSSERVPLPTNGVRRYLNAPVLQFNNGKSLPSKWEDAEKWIFSPGSGEGISSSRAQLAPPQRRPKSKSGPLGAPGVAGYSSTSPLMPLFDGGRVGNFVGSSPFSTGVLGAEGLSGRGCFNSSGSGGGGGGGGCGGGGSYPSHTDPCIVRSASVHGWSDLLIESLPSSQDEKVDGTKDVATMISPVVSRRDMATQMSPERSSRSSPKEMTCFSRSPSSALPTPDVQSSHLSKLEVRDVQVDDRVTMTRWSKKHKTRGSHKGSLEIKERKKKAVEARASAWEVAETEKCISKYTVDCEAWTEIGPCTAGSTQPMFKREEAKIVAWENLQKAKAEAEIRKLEMKLEKKRSSSMDKIMNKLRSAQRKAQEMRNTVSAGRQANQVARATDRAVSLCKAGQLRSLSGCFTCHAF